METDTTTESLEAADSQRVEAWPAPDCSAFGDLWNAAIRSRANAVERGDENKERYYRGVLDGLRASKSALSWRDPEKEHPTRTGKILVWIEGDGPAIVNVEERWMCYWNGHDETEPTDPCEWSAWLEIHSPNTQSAGDPD